MELKIISWDIQGFNGRGKWSVVKSLSKDWLVNVACLHICPWSLAIVVRDWGGIVEGSMFTFLREQKRKREKTYLTKKKKKNSSMLHISTWTDPLHGPHRFLDKVILEVGGKSWVSLSLGIQGCCRSLKHMTSFWVHSSCFWSTDKVVFLIYGFFFFFFLWSTDK